MKILSALIISGLSLWTTMSIAAPINNKHHAFYVGVLGGIASNNKQDTDSYFYSITPGDPHANGAQKYTNKATNTSNSLIYGLNFGYQSDFFAWGSKFGLKRIAIGVDLLANTFKNKGTWACSSVGAGNCDGSPSQPKGDYQVELKSYSVLFNTQLIFSPILHLSPFVILGVGPSWNTASNFTRTGDGWAPTYANKTTTALAYEVGLGVRYDYNSHLAFALSYRYLNDGKAKSGNISNKAGGIMPNKYSDGPEYSLHANTVLLNINYLF